MYISEDSSDEEEVPELKDPVALAERRSLVLAFINDSRDSELVAVPGFMKKRVSILKT